MEHGGTTVDEFKQILISAIPQMRAFALSLVGSSHDADDIVQEALERLLRRQLEPMEDTVNLVAYAITTVRNIVTDRRRYDSRFSPISAEQLVEKYQASGIPEHLIDTLNALSRLGIECQTLLGMIGQQYKYSEISIHVGLPKGTVGRKVLECRSRLSSIMSDGGNL